MHLALGTAAGLSTTLFNAGFLQESNKKQERICSNKKIKLSFSSGFHARVSCIMLE